MANIKSQIKRDRQSEKARRRNRGVRSALKTSIRKFKTAVAEKDKETAADALQQTIKKLDKAAAKRIIHPNNAAQKKSRLSKKFNSL